MHWKLSHAPSWLEPAEQSHASVILIVSQRGEVCVQRCILVGEWNLLWLLKLIVVRQHNWALVERGLLPLAHAWRCWHILGSNAECLAHWQEACPGTAGRGLCRDVHQPWQQCALAEQMHGCCSRDQKALLASYHEICEYHSSIYHITVNFKYCQRCTALHGVKGHMGLLEVHDMPPPSILCLAVGLGRKPARELSCNAFCRKPLNAGC